MSLLMNCSLNLHIQITRIFLHLVHVDNTLNLIITAYPRLIAQVEHGLFPVGFSAVRCSGEHHLLGTREVDLEITNKCMEIVGVVGNERERCRKVQVFLLYRIDIEILIVID